MLKEYANTEQLKQNKAVEDKITQRQTSQLHNEGMSHNYNGKITLCQTNQVHNESISHS